MRSGGQLVGGRLAQPVFVCNKRLLTDGVREKAEREGVMTVPIGDFGDASKQLRHRVMA